MTRRSGLLTAVTTATVAAASIPTVAAASPALPGPPPGAGTGLPLPPAAGQTPLPPAPGPARSIPADASGPALADGGAQVAATGRLTLRVACRANGAASLGVTALSARPVARAAYRCRDGRAAVRMRMAPADARRLTRMSPALGRVTLRQRDATARVSVALAAQGRSSSPGVWSDGGLQCASPGPSQTYLVAPNFTVTPATSLDIRPWIATYTQAGGWRWLGVQGPNASRWYRVTATPAGVAQWIDATGALNPWTWGPIDVPSGEGLSATAVFEVIYWYGGRPTYVWRYTSAHAAAQTIGSFCSYP